MPQSVFCRDAWTGQAKWRFQRAQAKPLRVGGLTQEQNGQWEFFKTQWDATQASAIGADWGKTFAEYIQDVLLKMLHGESDAFSKFVKKETDRVLTGKGALVAPGFPTFTEGLIGG